MIQIENMNFAYQKKQSLFDDLQLELGDSRICGLLGKNGSGKTTLLKLISGSLFSQSGAILFNGHDVSKRHPSFLQDLYFLQEDFIMPKGSIQDFAKDYGVFYPKFDQAKYNALLASFELPNDKNIKDLSFGQKKKLHVCFALATQVKLLILDEPTNGMDIPSKSKFRTVASQNLREDQLVIISTHQIRDLGQLLDNIVMVQNGKILVNDNLYDISKRFACEFTPGVSHPTNAIYAEQVPGGHMTLVKNETNTPGDMDIEVLFNAIISNPTLLIEKSN